MDAREEGGGQCSQPPPLPPPGREGALDPQPHQSLCLALDSNLPTFVKGTPNPSEAHRAPGTRCQSNPFETGDAGKGGDGRAMRRKVCRRKTHPSTQPPPRLLEFCPRGRSPQPPPLRGMRIQRPATKRTAGWERMLAALPPSPPPSTPCRMPSSRGDRWGARGQGGDLLAGFQLTAEPDPSPRPSMDGWCALG